MTRNSLYFDKIFNLTLKFINSNSADKIMHLNFIKNKFSTKLFNQKIKFTKKFPKKKIIRKNKNIIVGMNTVGLLLDRLTVLCLKLNHLKKKLKDRKKADITLFEVNSIIKALKNAQSIDKIDFNKITRHKIISNASNFEEAYFELLISNFILWESQEILYNRNINNCSLNEIRDYLKLFSKYNTLRNFLITKVENFYWQNEKKKY
ncbi:hypothetical protein [Candidatus Pelagibacter sp. HIMB1493]|uniref:hypothetical protein n=1 Tax=Candidatus Pelagibacter sp. HIMB1493 TaxID=3413334 RepID=UPI003F84436C